MGARVRATYYTYIIWCNVIERDEKGTGERQTDKETTYLCFPHFHQQTQLLQLS